MRWVRGAVSAVLLAGCSSGTDGGASTSPPPSDSSGPTTVAPEGFTAVIIEIARPDGTTESYCVWVAETGEQRQQGLMNVTSLGGADGMLFRFGAEQSASFWMKDTLLPLSIAFFADDGAFVSATDMEPCGPDVVTCPLYPASGPYSDALEVPQGGLGALGVGAGSRLTATDTSCGPSG